MVTESDSSILDYVKNPILIKNNNNNYEVISEKILQKLILEDIESFMNELGESFSFIGSEYKVKIGNTYNYIEVKKWLLSNLFAKSAVTRTKS